MVVVGVVVVVGGGGAGWLSTVTTSCAVPSTRPALSYSTTCSVCAPSPRVVVSNVPPSPLYMYGDSHSDQVTGPPSIEKSTR